MQTTNNSAIIVKDISKVYRLYKNSHDRLKEALHPRRKKYHKEFFALKNFCLDINKGEIIGIVGKNGSGKSTLLKILSRVLTPSSGNYTVKGKISSLLELGSALNPELTGMENIYFYGTVLGFSEDKLNGKLNEILDFADIGDFIYQPLRTYSSGMKMRLAFSVAINVDPDILILDEVLAVGDDLFRRKCYSRMEVFFQGQKTVLIVSHNVTDINRLCSRAVMIENGELIIEGPPKLVTSQYQRYLFSKSENSLQILDDIRNINKNDKLKQETYLALDNKEKESDLGNASATNKSDNTDLNPRKDLNLSLMSKQSAYFVEGFNPKSTVVYKDYDVEIINLTIRTTYGKIVNNILTGEDYFLEYRVKFGLDCKHVSFGMQIKDEKGFKYGGSSTYRSNNTIPAISKGDVYMVKWKFTCNLLSGNYFVNAGVSGIIDNKERVFLGRIIDALVFKVINVDLGLGGPVFFNQTVRITKEKN